jgi:hypothetical protein
LIGVGHAASGAHRVAGRVERQRRLAEAAVARRSAGGDAHQQLRADPRDQPRGIIAVIEVLLGDGERPVVIA